MLRTISRTSVLRPVKYAPQNSTFTRQIASSFSDLPCKAMLGRRLSCSHFVRWSLIFAGINLHVLPCTTSMYLNVAREICSDLQRSTEISSYRPILYPSQEKSRSWSSLTGSSAPASARHRRYERRLRIADGNQQNNIIEMCTCASAIFINKIVSLIMNEYYPVKYVEDAWSPIFFLSLTTFHIRIIYWFVESAQLRRLG